MGLESETEAEGQPAFSLLLIGSALAVGVSGNWPVGMSVGPPTAGVWYKWTSGKENLPSQHPLHNGNCRPPVSL